MVHFGTKLAFLQFSTCLNENIAVYIVLDSGIGIVAYNFNFFYRALHFSAKRGIAIACRLSVCLSVRLSLCDVGGL